MFVCCSNLQKGTKAPQAAGKIHTDFEKGFIMAEVMKFTDFKEEGSETAVKVRPRLYLSLAAIIASHSCYKAKGWPNTLLENINDFCT